MGVVKLDGAERALLVKHLVYEAQGVMEEAAGSNVEGDASAFLDAHAVVAEIAKAVRELVDRGRTTRLHAIREVPRELVATLRASVGTEATLLRRMEEGDPEVIDRGAAGKTERKATRKHVEALTRECAAAERVAEAVQLADDRQGGK